MHPGPPQTPPSMGDVARRFLVGSSTARRARKDHGSPNRPGPVSPLSCPAFVRPNVRSFIDRPPKALSFEDLDVRRHERRGGAGAARFGGVQRQFLMSLHRFECKPMSATQHPLWCGRLKEQREGGGTSDAGWSNGTGGVPGVYSTDLLDQASAAPMKAVAPLTPAEPDRAITVTVQFRATGQ